MSHILAIESDRNRRTLLMALIREHTRLADVTMVDSVTAAIASFEHKQPDMIVAPTLLSPEDSAQLTEHVKWHADPHVQMLTIPALDILRAPIQEERHRFAFFRRRRPVSLGLQYDPSMVGRQIADGLDRALTLREEKGTTMDVRALLRREEPRLIVEPFQIDPVDTVVTSGGIRDRAERTPQGGPCVWTVRMPWGSDVELVNISRTGVLLESGSKVTPGVTLELQLNGMGQHCIVMARFVRSQVARVDRLGVRYHAAAQFEQPLEILTPRVQSKPLATAQSLAELFTTVVSESDQPEDSCIRFARGLRGLIGARDVFVRPSPMVPSHDCESIYFRLSGDDRSGMILQVLFDRDRSLTTAEFKLLKAATGLTSALLDLEGVSSDETGLVKRQLAEVA
jgi:CheY-like chemotaxis protein